MPAILFLFSLANLVIGTGAVAGACVAVAVLLQVMLPQRIPAWAAP